jgi:hypothetical protein
MTDAPASNIHTLITEATAKRLFFLPHALSQMNSPARMISVVEVKKFVEHSITAYLPDADKWDTDWKTRKE